MSVVFDSRDVSAVGPTLGLDVVSSSPAAYVMAGGGSSSAQDKQGLVSCFPSSGDGRTKGEISTVIGFGVGSEKTEASSESSSIGVPDNSDDDDDDEGEVQSMSDGSCLASLASLEESLPIKRRGLSNNFSGKSKSFANLSEISAVKDLEKRENPLNKRRRTMIAYKWSRNSSLYGCRGNNSSMPILALNGVIGECQDEEDDDDDDDDGSKEEEQRFRQQQLKGSQSCFSLTDLPK